MSAPDLALLRRLAARTHTSADTIDTACRMAPGEVRGRLASLESRCLVAGRHDARLVPPARAFAITGEGRTVEG